MAHLKIFYLLYTDFLQNQILINFIQYNKFSGTLLEGFCLDAKLPHILSITPAKDRQNELLKKSWFSLRMTGTGFIFCSAPQHQLSLKPLPLVTAWKSFYFQKGNVSCSMLEIVDTTTWHMPRWKPWDGTSDTFCLQRWTWFQKWTEKFLR